MVSYIFCKTWKKQENDYSATNASGNTSPVDLSQNGEETTWTESSSSWATPRGWELEWPATTFLVTGP